MCVTLRRAEMGQTSHPSWGCDVPCLTWEWLTQVKLQILYGVVLCHDVPEKGWHGSNFRSFMGLCCAMTYMRRVDTGRTSDPSWGCVVPWRTWEGLTQVKLQILHGVMLCHDYHHQTIWQRPSFWSFLSHRSYLQSKMNIFSCLNQKQDNLYIRQSKCQSKL